MCAYTLCESAPAKIWEDTYPIGCGRMGATIFGGVSSETLYLNEESIWSEKEGAKRPIGMPEKLAQIRSLFLSGDPVAANKLANELLQGDFIRICSYESAGILRVSMHDNDECKHYRRTLDLINGVAYVEYDKDGSHYTREYLASYPDNVIACRFTSTQKDMTLHISYDRDRILETLNTQEGLSFLASTQFGNHRFALKIRIISDGSVKYAPNGISVRSAREVCVYVSITTEIMHGENFASVSLPVNDAFEVLKTRHTKDFATVMSRADISLPDADSTLALQWQLGRYLLVSASRPGTLPANLQGLWTKGDVSPWNSDYHTNINLQMNYWGAEVANLSDCHLPLFEYMNHYLLESGKQTAKEVYGTRGCVVHHLSDIYGFTSMADGPWGLWPHGASWLALHMWEHYLFTRDLDFLKNEAFAFIREAALFFLDNLIVGANGCLLYAPSTSPENHYYAVNANGERHDCYLAASSTMDVQIITTLFRILLESAALLSFKDETVEAVKSALNALPPMKIGKDGRLLEWLEDYEEVEPEHRHISHSFGLYPAAIISRATPDLYTAVANTIKRREEAAREHSGWSVSNIPWSLIWLSCSYSRLRNASKAYEKLSAFSQECVSASRWAMYPLNDTYIFQIDANLGYVAAISEMLIQSHEGVLSILPALPVQWSDGAFRGLRARGGFEVSATWRDARLTSLTVQANHEAECVLELPTNGSLCDESGTVYTPIDGRLTLHVSTAPITLNAM